MTHSSWLIQKSAEAIFCFEQLLFAQQLTWKWFLALLLFLIIVQICHERRFSDDESLFIFLLTPTKSVCHLTKEKDLLKQKEFSIKWFCSLTHTLSTTHTYSHSIVHTHTHTHSLSFSLSLSSHTQAHARKLKPTKVAKNKSKLLHFLLCFFSGWVTQILSHSLSLKNTHTHALIQSAILSCPIPLFWRLSFPHIINFLSSVVRFLLFWY